MGTKSSVDRLNGFLRGELAAVETYRMALDNLDANSPARFELDEVLHSHERRVIALRQAVMTLGGVPDENAGPWGMFARAVESTARAFGDTAAIRILEEGEDHGLEEYRDELGDEDLDLQTRTFLASHLLPAQQATHARMSALKKSQR